MNKENEISIVVPIFNEGKNIDLLTKNIIKKLNKIKFEIIFVDDSSKDNSRNKLYQLKKKYKFFKPIFRKKKRDLTQSCFEGIEKSKFKNVLIMDGDLQHDPKYIMPMYKKYKKGKYDILVGARPLVKGPNQGLSETRRFASRLLIFLFKIFNIKTSDPMSGFFVFKKKIYLKNKNFYFGKGFKILADILINSKNTIKIGDFFIVFKRRYENKSKMNLRVLLILVYFYFFSFFKKVLF